ncbi:adenine methyltransferase [Spirochaetia bacterium]|nr:adenine methyltransferase [Spirochaetia bacterium]
MNEKNNKLKTLTDRFESNLPSYISNSYDESNTRTDFIDRFLELLGWDVRNEQGFSEIYRDVVREDKVVINGQTKAPDYSFRVGGIVKFYVEAKKPSVNIKENTEPAYQVRRYAWTKKLPLSILTDFEEFAIYDTRIKPNSTDAASVARIFYCTFHEYEKQFDFIYNTFSKNAILKGSFDKYIDENKNKKGTSEVDSDLLSTIESWREQLSKNIAIRNNEISIYKLNTAVQKIIDRVIFLRIAEDKSIEDEAVLKTVIQTQNIYEKLNLLFEKANIKYNSGLFISDEWLLHLNIDDKILKDIIENLYYPKCPYEFSVLPIEILGNIYEKFLGKEISFRGVKGGHTAIIEDKPEVKKAGGVFYTPQYIVDFIVRETIGKAINGRAPIDVVNLKICDPSCGSGSFLVGSYTYLLNYHLNYYCQEKNIKNALKNEKIYETTNKNQGTNYKLTITEKQKILLNNIYGVDIDSQAVEVTKLSLYLKLLENETKEAEGQLFKHSDLALLPSLENNIKCGNSLINTDFYDKKDTFNFDVEQQRKINAFDWKEEFLDIFKNGGFDIVIGNPPYVKEYTSREIFEDIKKSHLAKYYEGKMDLWYFFVCHGIDILKPTGKLGFIAPSNWITNSGASILRNKLMTESKIENYVDFGDFMVFAEASIQTCVFILNKQLAPEGYTITFNKVLSKKISATELIAYLTNNQTTKNVSSTSVLINPAIMKDGLINFVGNDKEKILQKIAGLANYTFNEKEIAQGIVCPQDSLLTKHLDVLKNNDLKKGDGVFVINTIEKTNLKLAQKEDSIVKPYYTTEQLKTYFGDTNNSHWVIYSDLSVRQNISKYPNIKQHLDKYKKIITSDFAPYGLHRAREQKFFEGEKIISLRKTPYPRFTYNDFPCYVSQSYYVLKPQNINLKYLLGILNSHLMYFWLYNRGKKQGEQLQVDKEPLLDIPVFIGTDAQQQELIDLVDKMLMLLKQEHETADTDSKNIIQRTIKATQKMIDKAVYGLYRLDIDEVDILERA